MTAQAIIRRRALRIKQGSEQPLYLFALRADELLEVADISRVSRDRANHLIGYQRPEVRRHVQNIVTYLNTNNGNVLFPNSLILALSSAVRFIQVRGPRVEGESFAEAGTLEIRLPRNGQPKPAWIVDGQQRALALSTCKRRDIPVPVSAFVADDVDTQRDQFLRVNSTKPLPRGLITELLPSVTNVLPANLTARRAPAALCEMLNADPRSPFHGLIKRSSDASNKRKSAVLSDTTIVQVLQDSLTTPSGCLFSYRNIATGETDFDGVRQVLFTYWSGVKAVFPDAWGLPPTKSRLMHSAGLRAMGKLMDRIMAAVDVDRPGAPDRVRREIARVKPVCRWTSGVWDELGGLEWDEVQNVPAHIRMLSNALVRAHMSSRMGDK
jgi:DGQHR domain-containing protein